MAKVILSAEGQTLDLPDDLASDDQKLRQALVAYYPQLATAKIERADRDGVMTVTVSKQAGPKGARRKAPTPSTFVDALRRAPEHLNPAVALLDELGGTDIERLPLVEALMIGDLVAETIDAGEREVIQVRGVFQALREAEAVPAPAAPEGF
jgi:hypothetical protein